MNEVRVGIGSDIHCFSNDRKLILGGVEIPFEQGLLGHSDADVLLHAIMDALLGAVALGDIGKHFPDTDEKNEIIIEPIKLKIQVDYDVANDDIRNFADYIMDLDPSSILFMNIM